MMLMLRWKPQWVGAGSGLEMIQAEQDNYWMGGAGWSEESGSPQQREYSVVRQNHTHP